MGLNVILVWEGVGGGMGVVHILWHIIENELCFVCIFYVCIVMFTIIDVNIFCDFGHCGTGADGRGEVYIYY